MVEVGRPSIVYTSIKDIHLIDDSSAFQTFADMHHLVRTPRLTVMWPVCRSDLGDGQTISGTTRDKRNQRRRFTLNNRHRRYYRVL